ncbi:dnaJ homolog subfamily B member 1-like isoform X2 [Neltuma alba]|uniref:dnaJ homolog subfamily B member 1-like isoform X2 n=1 Tax=Neltuma alba TaxID=207710 RepID=UPI0010A547D8|nr:dnaJ homolog subfamily B member 1-like isoform X2 [Prosopis alba]
MVDVSPVTSIRDLNRTKSYKSLFRKWFSCKQPSSPPGSPLPVLDPKHDLRRRTPSPDHRVSVEGGNPEETSTANVVIQSFRSCDASLLRGLNDDASPTGNLCRHKSLDKCFPSISALSKNVSRKSRTPATSPIARINVKSREREREKEKESNDSVHNNPCTPKSARRIMYSNSSGMLKPPPIEQDLECTLEDLCFGCKKKVNLTRHVPTHSGEDVEEEEVLTINVKPGWRKGTKIKFEGKANDGLGAYEEDVIYCVSEKRHDLFTREGDDLELGLEIPLVKALTGSTISVPLLGGKRMDLTMDDQIVYPGFRTIVRGLGMPMSNDPQKRGDLRITFLVQFPTQLTHDQRSQVVNILQDSGRFTTF